MVLLAALLVLPALGSGQESKVVMGTVVSSNTSMPLSGVQITVKGLTIGTVSARNGRFSIVVPTSATTLVFSLIGHKTAEATISADMLEVAMEQAAIGLEGIVVTALGVRREKRSLGYSVQQITGAELTEVPEINLVNSLQGMIAGVRVTAAGPMGGSARIVIRGANSITGNNQPLFIVDGIPVDNSAPRNAGYGGIDYGNAVQDIDPANIESISVLKGPNAAALYGSRAANGAVVITTKSGRGNAGFSFSTSFTAENPLKLPDYQNVYGQGVNGEFQFVDGAGAGTWDFVDESWGPRMDGRLIDQFTGPNMPWIPHPDNVRSFFRTGMTSNTNISFSQASDQGDVRLSLTRTSVEGMAPSESIRKTSIALKGGLKMSERFSTQASLNYTNQNADNRMGTGYDEDNPMQSFIWFGRQVDMDALRNYRCTETSPTACTEGGQFNWNYNYHNNPFWEQEVNTNNDTRDRLLGHVSATFQLNDWITMTGRIGRDWYREHRKAVTAFHSLDDAGDGGFRESTRFQAETNADLILTAARQLTDNITLDITTGGNIRATEFQSAGVSVSALTAPGIFTIDNASASPIPTDFESHKKVRSVYGSVSLNYRGFLNVDFTGRNDWSSTLPLDNYSYFYPSVSSAFVFSEALGWESDFFSSGKIRASWTRVGNDTGPYQLASVYNAQTAFGSAPMFSVPNALPNASLKPEETTAYEFGADLGFMNERMGFVLTFYNSQTRNQILGVQVSASSGYTSQILNAGEVKNFGYEVLFRATPVLGDGFQWDVTVNWGKNNSEVTELYGDLETLVLGSYWSMNIEARKGEAYGVFFGNGYLMDDDGNWILDSRGRPQRDTNRSVLGNYNPDWIGGIQNRIRYGRLALSVLVDGQRGGDIFSVTNWFGEYAGVLKSTLRGRGVDFCDPGIIVPGVFADGSVNGDGVNDVTVCPESYFGRNYGNQAAGIDDATYVKLREVRLGYKIPSSFMGRFGFVSGDIALIGRNLLLWAPNIDNIDPETAFDASNVQGIEFGQYPSSRSIGLSLSIRP